MERHIYKQVFDEDMDEVLSDDAVRKIEAARARIKRGNHVSEEEAKKRLKL